jgi:predicted lipoprotein with Yx(FWY)xxD motif
VVNPNLCSQEVTVKNALIAVCTAAAAVALAAGCGSSGNSTTTATSSAAAATSKQATPGSRYGAGAATTSNPVAGSATGVTISVKHAKPGTILAAGPKNMTVYLFEADKNGQSACSGECAKDWPPVTTGGRPQVNGASSAMIGTIMRSDGTKQVTYNGHPLYFFEKDGDAGDAYGQGVKAFGANWYVVAPSGNKIDNDEEHHSGGDQSAS